MKKVFLMLMLVLSAGFVFIGCGNGSGKDYSGEISGLKARLDALEDENQALKNANQNLLSRLDGFGLQLDGFETQLGGFGLQLDGLETQLDGLLASAKIYGLGDTVTVVQNGIQMFSITYESKTLMLDNNSFIVTNLNMPYLNRNMIYAVMYNSETNISSDYYPQSSYAIAVGGRASLNFHQYKGGDYLYFGFPTVNGGYIPYAIFKTL